MATPGYPQMMGGPMAPMPGGAMQMPRPMRRGSPKIVPVVVSAGLAVGVFCGLLFGLGTGKSNASPAGPVSNGVKANEEPMAPQSVKSDVKTPPVAAKAGSGSAVAAGSAAAGSAAAG